MIKRIVKSFSISAALCLAFVFGSCLSEPIISPVDNGEENGVVIRFNGATRGTAQGGRNAVLNTGYLFMTSSMGAIIQQFEIHDNATRGTNVNAGYLYIGHLESNNGVPIPSVPANVHRIVIVGNTTLSPAPAIGTNIADIGVQRINVLTQHDVSSVNLWGETRRDNADDWVYDATEQKYRVMVNLFPTVARMELYEIRACPIHSQIESFRVEAIFVDRHYYLAQVSGATLDVDVTVGSPPATFANFVSRGHGTTLGFGFAVGQRGYGSVGDTSGALFNIIGADATGAGTALNPLTVAIPGHDAPTRNRWAYNLFAMQRTLNVAGNVISRGTPMPSIVIRVSNVRLAGETTAAAGNFYLTIRGIIDTRTDTELTGIHALHVYEIEPVVFTEQHLSRRPNEVLIDVDVRITLATWDGRQVIRPGFRQPAPMNATVGCPPINHPFRLGDAENGDCTNPSDAMRYRWQQSADGGVTWTYVSEISDNTDFTFISPVSIPSRHFRRVAICGCGQRHYSQPAILTSPTRTYDPAWTPTFDPGVLIAGTVWATRNVGVPGHFVDHPADAGLLYQWNSDVAWSHTHGTEGAITRPTHRWDPAANSGNGAWVANNPNLWSQLSVITGTTWNPIAGGYNRGPCPVGWRLPTNAELVALADASPALFAGTNSNVVLNSDIWHNRGQWMGAVGTGAFACQAGVVYGTLAGAHIFLPAVGGRDSGGALFYQGTWGIYWSGQAVNTSSAGTLQFSDGNGSRATSFTHRPQAFSVRCVAE